MVVVVNTLYCDMCRALRTIATRHTTVKAAMDEPTLIEIRVSCAECDHIIFAQRLTPGAYRNARLT